MLLHRQRIIGAAFYRGVVGDDHAFDAFDPADTGDHAGGGDALAVYLVSRQRGDFEKGRTGVEEGVDALAHQQFATRHVTLLSGLATAFADAGEQGAQILDLLQHRCAIGSELGRTGIDLGMQDGHGQAP